MIRRWRTPLTFACIFATALAGGWFMHARNRDRRLREFQNRQLNAIGSVAAVVQTGLTGTTRTLRLLAAAVEDRDDTDVARLLAGEQGCSAPPCPAAITIYRADGTAARSAVRPVALNAEQVRAAIGWSRDASAAGAVRSTIAHSPTPALVLMARTGSGGFVAEEVLFDSLFAAAHATPDADAPYALLVVNNTGDVMFRSGHPEMRLNNLFTRGARCAACHQSLAHVDRMIAMQRGVLEYSIRNTPQLAAVAPVAFEGQTWTAAAIAPAATALALVTSEAQDFALLAMATFIGCGVAVHLTWRERQRQHRVAAEASRKAQLERSHSALSALNVKLESAAEEWRMTVDTIDAAILVLDPGGSIERMNRVAADMLPGPTFSWLGQPSAALAGQPPWDSALALAGEALERDGVSMERVRVGPSGRTWDLWCRAAKRHDDRRSVVIVARDVTALVELQASVRRSETMAALGLVVAGVAHEVRNPLFAISSLVDAWALQPLTAPGRLIDALRSEVGRLKTLMTELLEYGSPSAAELAPARLAPVVNEAVNACRHDVETRGVEVRVSVPPELELSMDTRRLMRVLLNLLQNAAQHAPAGSTVTLTAQRAASDGGAVSIEVCDEGTGFAPDDLPRLFTPFFSRRAGGFGLGLAISERIVGEHGGTLAAANRPEGGARMTISLPAGPAALVSRVTEGAQPC